MSQSIDTTPFSGLTPDDILNALDAVGMRTDGRLLPLNSYENRVYQVGIEGGAPVIAKFYRPGRWTDAAIREEHVFLRALADLEIPVVPPLSFPDGATLLVSAGFRFAVFPRHGGHAPELDRMETLRWMGRFIARIHAVGAIHPFEHRGTLDLQTFGAEPSSYLLSQRLMSEDLEAVYRNVVADALDGIRRCYERAGPLKLLRLHGDCHPGNVLWTGAGPHFVDFDDSRMGPAIQDLWMLLSGDRADMALQLGYILAGYEQFFEFDTRTLHLVEALRTLRLIHYAAWIARRWDDPAFPPAFPWFNTRNYWQERIHELRIQIELMEEPVLSAARP